jgi:hypothetical protein
MGTTAYFWTVEKLRDKKELRIFFILPFQHNDDRILSPMALLFPQYSMHFTFIGESK